jgi:hypothetical protein
VPTLLRCSPTQVTDLNPLSRSWDGGGGGEGGPVHSVQKWTIALRFQMASRSSKRRGRPAVAPAAAVPLHPPSVLAAHVLHIVFRGGVEARGALRGARRRLPH